MTQLSRGPGSSAQNSNRPNRQVVAGTSIIEYRARDGAVGTPEPFEKDVIQPSNGGGGRAALGGPGVANVTCDPSETRVVQVTAEHDAGVSLCIRQDRLQLVATRRW